MEEARLGLAFAAPYADSPREREGCGHRPLPEGLGPAPRSPSLLEGAWDGTTALEAPGRVYSPKTRSGPRPGGLTVTRMELPTSGGWPVWGLPSPAGPLITWLLLTEVFALHAQELGLSCGQWATTAALPWLPHLIPTFSPGAGGSPEPSPSRVAVLGEEQKQVILADLDAGSTGTPFRSTSVDVWSAVLHQRLLGDPSGRTCIRLYFSEGPEAWQHDLTKFTELEITAQSPPGRQAPPAVARARHPAPLAVPVPSLMVHGHSGPPWHVCRAHSLAWRLCQATRLRGPGRDVHPGRGTQPCSRLRLGKPSGNTAIQIMRTDLASLRPGSFPPVHTGGGLGLRLGFGQILKAPRCCPCPALPASEQPQALLTEPGVPEPGVLMQPTAGKQQLRIKARGHGGNGAGTYSRTRSLQPPSRGPGQPPGSSRLPGRSRQSHWLRLRGCSCDDAHALAGSSGCRAEMAQSLSTSVTLPGPREAAPYPSPPVTVLSFVINKQAGVNALVGPVSNPACSGSGGSQAISPGIGDAVGLTRLLPGSCPPATPTANITSRVASHVTSSVTSYVAAIISRVAPALEAASCGGDLPGSLVPGQHNLHLVGPHGPGASTGTHTNVVCSRNASYYCCQHLTIIVTSIAITTTSTTIITTITVSEVLVSDLPDVGVPGPRPPVEGTLGKKWSRASLCTRAGRGGLTAAGPARGAATWRLRNEKASPTTMVMELDWPGSALRDTEAPLLSCHTQTLRPSPPAEQLQGPMDHFHFLLPGETSVCERRCLAVRASCHDCRTHGAPDTETESKKGAEGWGEQQPSSKHGPGSSPQRTSESITSLNR
ncbi:hypothetical protein TREES_T100016071 [Tupaia chinensis]|uniref:Uncharacterized protein n=1 Tax=Tupaia chinensis TaxID=246437 RepID=L9KQI3_TUPCH|nr:hypothetical protein TREES_T100016071 [Tupaia chinensis]